MIVMPKNKRQKKTPLVPASTGGEDGGPARMVDPAEKMGWKIDMRHWTLCEAEGVFACITCSETGGVADMLEEHMEAHWAAQEAASRARIELWEKEKQEQEDQTQEESA
jgi:hypothetical protein